MKSTPITQRAGIKYGSTPATVDAAGTTPAKFEKMSPIKQVDLVGGAGKVYGSQNRPGGTTTKKGKEKTRNKTWDDLRAEGWSEAEIDKARAWRDENQDAPRTQVGTGEFEPDEIIENPDIETSYEAPLMEATYGTVKSTPGSRKDNRKIKIAQNNMRKQAIKSGTDRKTAKKEAQDWANTQFEALRARTAQEISSGKTAGSKYLTGERQVLKGQMSKEEQRAQAAYEANNPSSTNNTGTSDASTVDTSNATSTATISTQPTFQERMAKIKEESRNLGASLLGPESGMGQTDIKMRNSMLDFAAGAQDLGGPNASSDSYVDKTGRYRNPFYESRMNPQGPQKKGSAFKMKGFMNKK